MPVQVAIRSVAFPQHYVRLEGQGLTSFADDGGGTVNAQSYISSWETFILQLNDDGTVSFKSSAFDQVFLRMKAADVPKDQELPYGGGIVNAQYTAREWERFHIHKKDGEVGQFQGVVGIESAAFPGRFLRLDGNTGTVNVQGICSDWEQFHILVVGI